MLDVLVIVIVIVFFLLADLVVRGCSRIVDSRSLSRTKEKHK